MEPGRDDREHRPRDLHSGRILRAAMEPGRDDREHQLGPVMLDSREDAPRWSPVAMTGNTHRAQMAAGDFVGPRWSPVAMTGNTPATSCRGLDTRRRDGARSR